MEAVSGTQDVAVHHLGDVGLVDARQRGEFEATSGGLLVLGEKEKETVL